MRAVRYAALLALVMWIGGLVTLGALVAPAAFGVIEAQRGDSDRLLAGALFGVIFARFHLVAYGAAGVLFVSLVLRRLLGPKPIHFGVRIAVLAIMLGITLYSGLVLTRDVARTQAELAAPASTLPEGHPSRVRFERLHGWSVALALVAVAGGLLLLGYEAADT
jgi:hypothetical protein